MSGYCLRNVNSPWACEIEIKYIMHPNSKNIILMLNQNERAIAIITCSSHMWIMHEYSYDNLVFLTNINIEF